jgi:glycosyltransferase involved in cell wall biosynthesis
LQTEQRKLRGIGKTTIHASGAFNTSAGAAANEAFRNYMETKSAFRAKRVERLSGGEGGSFPIIVHSHLAWDWVWQRPQQFLSRLSSSHRVLFIETPVLSAEVSTSRMTIREVADFPNILVLRMKIPAAQGSKLAWVDRERRRMLGSFLAGPLGQHFESPVQWFYDPMAVTAFAGRLNERAIVYDCMDELSLFRGAPSELIARERKLLAVADVVFAGGPKIWKAKKQLNENCFAFGCGVDVSHFGQARDRHLSAPADTKELSRPLFGYFGVVDERLDYELLERLSDATSGSVVMIGPSTKIDPASLPRRANLHWLGGRDYSDLPAYAKAFDVCLMPYAMNEATEFINPTKALEYMATGRPIVSTAVEDVVMQFSDVVSIAQSVGEFVQECKRLAWNPSRTRIERGLVLARKNSWESIVARLERHVRDILATEAILSSHAA